MTFRKLAVGLWRHCLGDLLRILAANLVRMDYGADFGADFPIGCANLWREFLAEAAKPQNRAFSKDRTKFRPRKSRPHLKEREKVAETFRQCTFLFDNLLLFLTLVGVIAQEAPKTLKWPSGCAHLLVHIRRPPGFPTPK